MYFMPRSNRVYSFFAPMPWTYRYLVTLLCMGSMWYGWHRCVYIPVAHFHDHMDHTIQEIRTKQQEHLTSMLQTTLETDVDVLRCSLRDHNSGWKKSGIESLLTYVNQAGVLFISCDLTTKKREPWCLQDTVTMRLQGSCPQIMKFFSLITASDVGVSCDQLAMTSSDGKLYALSCVLTVLTYS